MIEKLYWIGKIYFVSFFSFICLVVGTNLLYSQIISTSLIAIFFVLSFFIGWIFIDRKWINLLLTFVILLALSIIWFILFYFIWDISVDGNTYHLEIIIKLFKWASLFFDSFKSTWLSYYPKTIEILFSWFSSFFKNPDMWRILKIFLIWISLINSLYLIKKIRNWKFKRRYFLLATIIVLNPVVIYQFFTLYIDDILYLLLINFFIYFFIWETKMALLVFAIMISSKISYLLFGGLWLVAIIWINGIYYRKSYIGIIKHTYMSISTNKIIRISIITLIGIVWLHQYIINAYRYHNSLYGFAWAWKQDIISMFQPPVMKDRDVISKFAYTYFSYSRNYCITDDCQRFINPTTKAWIREFFWSYQTLGKYDPNLNGFWNIYSILLILSIAFLIYHIANYKKRKNKSQEIISTIIVAYILLDTSLLPFPRARYFPLLYLLPIIFILSSRNKIKIGILILYLINGLIIVWIITTIYWRNGASKIRQYEFMNKVSINKIYYTKFLKESYFYEKFFWYYQNRLKNIEKIEIDRNELLKKCWISSYLQVNEAYDRTLKCPKWWYVLRGDYGSHTDEFFYIN